MTTDNLNQCDDKKSAEFLIHSVFQLLESLYNVSIMFVCMSVSLYVRLSVGSCAWVGPGLYN